MIFTERKRKNIGDAAFFFSLLTKSVDCTKILPTLGAPEYDRPIIKGFFFKLVKTFHNI